MVTITNKMTSYISGNRNVSIDSYFDRYEDDTCSECDIEEIRNTCNKCGNGVCNQSGCKWSFPHTFNTTMIICKGCFDKIDNKLINYNHLLVYKFIKQNVRRRRLSC